MVSSYYPVFAGKNPQNDVKFLTETFQLKVVHHFSSDFQEYYVLEDASGNRLDVMRHNQIDALGFYGVRVNVDNFDAMANALLDQGYEYSIGPFDTPVVTVAVMENPNNPVAHRYIVSHHKKY